MTQQAVLADGLMPAAGNGAVPAGARPAGRRVVLVQTKAEAAGAQEITRILGRGLTARGYDVYSIFLFRRTAAFDREPNTAFCAAQRPTGPVTLLKMFVALVRHLKELQPDVALCFQHYGILVGTLAAHMAGTPIVIANRTSSKSLVPRWARAADLAFGLIGLFRRVVVNCRAIEQEYAAFPRRYRNRVMRIDHGFEAKAAALGRNDARKLLKLPADATLVGSVGRLHPGKNPAAAIRILPGRDWHLALAGQGEARRELAALAAALGVNDRVHFLGELPPARIGAFLRALDVFVFPSLAETFGLAAVRSRASRSPGGGQRYRRAAREAGGRRPAVRLVRQCQRHGCFRHGCPAAGRGPAARGRAGVARHAIVATLFPRRHGGALCRADRGGGTSLLAASQGLIRWRPPISTPTDCLTAPKRRRPQASGSVLRRRCGTSRSCSTRRGCGAGRSARAITTLTARPASLTSRYASSRCATPACAILSSTRPPCAPGLLERL